MSNGTKLLQSEEDFEWHKALLYAKGTYYHKHNGKPIKYPCKVHSEHWDDPNGPYNYDHTFTYEVETVCSACGHKEIDWPKEQA